MELIYAIDIYKNDAYEGTYEVAEVYADETIEEIEKEGYEYTISVYQYYIPSWHYSGKILGK